MNYAETIIQSMMYYPTLYSSVLGVQEHLFVVNGNGYEWINGELVDPYPMVSDREVGRTRESLLGLKYRKNQIDEINQSIEMGILPVISEGARIDAKISRLYPICEYAKIMAVYREEVEPTDSWKVGIYEFSRKVLSWSAFDYKAAVRVTNLQWNSRYPMSEEMKNLAKIKKVCRNLEKRYRNVNVSMICKKLDLKTLTEG